LLVVAGKSLGILATGSLLFFGDLNIG